MVGPRIYKGSRKFTESPRNYLLICEYWKCAY